MRKFILLALIAIASIFTSCTMEDKKMHTVYLYEVRVTPSTSVFIKDTVYNDNLMYKVGDTVNIHNTIINNTKVSDLRGRVINRTYNDFIYLVRR